MIALRVQIALATVATATLVSGCATNQGQQARVSGQNARCVREFGPSGKVPPVVIKCPQKP